MPKIDVAAIPARMGSGYPPPFDAPCAARTRRRLGEAGGLRDFGVNLMTLPPGSWSSQRHWHSDEDEFVHVLEGELTLIEDDGETVLRAGDCATFPKGTGNGHHLVNRSSAMAVYLEVGSRDPRDLTTCSDIDMMSSNADGRFVHKDGTPYPKQEASMNETTNWRNGVAIVRGQSLDSALRGPAGGRATAFDFAGTGGRETWIGAVTLAPNGETGTHHHGRHEVAIYVVRGHSEIRWGERLEFAADVGPGDFVYFAPHVPHQERNPSASEAVDFVVVRSDNERIVVRLDTAPVEQPETIRS